MRPQDDRPPGYHRAELEERLTGLGLVAGGLLLFGVAYLLWLYMPTSIVPPGNLPRGVMPIASPLTCMVPVIAIQASVLVLIGLRKLLFAE
ncbi:MAG: hypothetical protein AB7P40_30315 [Chloroflexota bacterium]